MRLSSEISNRDSARIYSTDKVIPEEVITRNLVSELQSHISNRDTKTRDMNRMSDPPTPN